MVMGNMLYAQEKSADTIHQHSIPGHFLTFKGYVVGGENKERLPGAYIYLGEKKIAITTTNSEGEFLISKLSEGEVRISVSYTGYQNFSEIFDVKNDSSFVEINLQSIQLEEVVVKATPPLTVLRGDTTQYNMAALKLRVDADLEDLLKKLPGFEIVDGKIIVHGKEVTKLYIDGMEYSFNDPSAALKNLPAKLINKIKMYDDRSEESKFSGFDDGTKYRTLNLITHQPEQMKVFGKLEVGYGITDPVKNTFKEKNYRASVSGNVFDLKRKITLRGNLENFAQNNELPQSVYKGKGGDNSSQAIYTNLSSKWGKKVTFSGNYHFSRRNSYSASLSEQIYFPTDRYENRIYDRENHSWRDGHDQALNIRVDYRINEKNNIIVSQVLSTGKHTSRSLGMGRNIENSDTINSSITKNGDKRNDLRTDSDIYWMHGFRKIGRTFSIRLQGSYNRNFSDQSQNNEERSLNSENAYIDTIRNLLIENQRANYHFSTAFTWFEPVSEHARFSFNYWFQKSNDCSENESLSYRDEEFEELIGLDSAQTNKLNNQNQSHNLGVNYNYHVKKVSLNGGFSINHTQMNNRYKYPGKVDSLIRSIYTDLSPRVNVNIHANENSIFDLSYQGSSSSPNAVQLQDVLNVTDPLQVSKGNPDLKKSYTHHIFMNFSRAIPAKSVFIYTSLSGGQIFNQIASNVKFIQRDTLVNGYALVRGARLTTPVNLNGHWNVSASTNYSFPWKKLKLRFNTSGSYSFSHNPSVYDDLRNITSSHSGNVGLSISTNFSEDLDINIASHSSYTYSRNTTTGGSQYFSEGINSFVNWVFYRGFFIRGGYNGRFYVNKKGESVNQVEHIVDGTIGKKFGKNQQMEFTLSANDILQERNTVNYSLNDLYSETSYHTIPSAYYLFSFSYRFNNMDN